MGRLCDDAALFPCLFCSLQAAETRRCCRGLDKRREKPVPDTRPGGHQPGDRACRNRDRLGRALPAGLILPLSPCQVHRVRLQFEEE